MRNTSSKIEGVDERVPVALDVERQLPVAISSRHRARCLAGHLLVGVGEPGRGSTPGRTVVLLEVIAACAIPVDEEETPPVRDRESSWNVPGRRTEPDRPGSSSVKIVARAWLRNLKRAIRRPSAEMPATSSIPGRFGEAARDPFACRSEQSLCISRPEPLRRRPCRLRRACRSEGRTACGPSPGRRPRAGPAARSGRRTRASSPAVRHSWFRSWRAGSRRRERSRGSGSARARGVGASVSCPLIRPCAPRRVPRTSAVPVRVWTWCPLTLV